MTTRWKTLLIVACLGSASLFVPSKAHAQDAALAHSASEMELFDAPSPSVTRQSETSRLPSPAERQQALAWHQRLQRVARMEAAEWRGYHLSRPPGVVTPATTSRYRYYHTFVIPVYVDNFRR